MCSIFVRIRYFFDIKPWPRTLPRFEKMLQRQFGWKCSILLDACFNFKYHIVLYNYQQIKLSCEFTLVLISRAIRARIVWKLLPSCPSSLPARMMITRFIHILMLSGLFSSSLTSVSVPLFLNFFWLISGIVLLSGAPNDNFRKIICSEDDLRSRIFGSFSDKFLACLPLLGFLNFKKIV